MPWVQRFVWLCREYSGDNSIHAKDTRVFIFLFFPEMAYVLYGVDRFDPCINQEKYQRSMPGRMCQT